MKCCYCSNEVTKEDIEKNLSFGFKDICCEKCWKENERLAESMLKDSGITIFSNEAGTVLDLNKIREFKKE